MKYTELKANLKQQLDSAYLISGEDRYLCFDALKKIEDAANITIADMNSVTISGEGATCDDIVASASIYPFGDEKRLVVVKNFVPPKAKTDKAALETYLNNPLSTTVLVFFNPESGDAFKGLSNITLVDCSKIESKWIAAFVKNQFAKDSIEISDDAMEKLIMFTNSDMTRIVGELEKLSAFAFETKLVTSEMVENFVVQDENFEVYQLADFLAKGDAVKVFALVDSYMTRPGSAFLLISPLYQAYRRALFVSINKEKTPAELASLLGVKEFAIKMLKNQVSAFSPKKLKLIVDMIAEYDKKIKTGEIKEAVAIKTIASNILNIRG